MDPTLNRRQLLRTGGIASAVVMGGCSSNFLNNQTADTATASPGSGQATQPEGQANQVPDYVNYIIPTNNQSVIMYADMDSFYDLFPEEGLAEFDDDTRLVDYPPLVRFPFGISFSLAVLASFALAPIGSTDGALIRNEQEDEFQTEITELIGSRFYSPGASFVAKGSIVTEEIEQALRTASEDTFDPEMRQVDAVEGYPIYQQVEPSTNTPNGPVDDTGEIAVGETEIIVGTKESITRVIETKQGNRATVAEQFDPLDWALTTAGDGDMVFGGYGSDGVTFREFIGGGEEFYRPDVLFDANGFLISNTVGSDEITAEMAAMFENLAPQQQNELQQRFGTQANDYSMSLKGSRVSASGTYDRGIITPDTS